MGEKEIYRMMKEYDGVIIWDLPANIRNRYLKHCFAHSIRCYLSPKISDVILMGSERIHLFDTPLLVAKNMGLSIEQRAAKRLLDIIISGIGIIVASPLMLIIALCVKLYDRGPVLYRQERLTEGGRPFKICKFRSMCVDSEKNGARLASKHDSRITPVGRVLRNLHLDELPQLFNVFMGDMSLVGPRPERQTLVREYCKEIPEFYYRLKVKAGLTGYAQVYGKYNTTPYDKLKLDLFYIENYSFVLDLKLLMMTVKIFFQKEVSEGVNDNQTNALKDSVDPVKELSEKEPVDPEEKNKPRGFYPVTFFQPFSYKSYIFIKDFVRITDSLNLSFVHPHNSIAKLFQSFDTMGDDNYGTIFVGDQALHLFIALFLNFWSPTLNTSSISIMSVSRIAVMEKASLEYIPLE